MKSYLHNSKRKFAIIFMLVLFPVFLSAQTIPQPTPPLEQLDPAKISPITGLPGDPQPNLSNLGLPNRPMPNAERIGVDQMNQLPISLEDAIKMALENNNDVDNSRIDTKISEFGLKISRGAYIPNITSDSFYQSATTPAPSVIGGAGTSGSVKQTSAFANIGVNGLSTRYGGSYAATFSSSRTTTNNLNATLNPQFPNIFSFTYTQPLMRGRKFDAPRRNIEIAKKNQTLTDSQFRGRIINVVSQIEQSYWDLVFALRNLQVQNDAVKQARIQLESNKRLVKQGVLAPVEIIAATAQITNFEQNVYAAQDSVTRAENTLKSLISSERTAEIWSRPLTPITPVEQKSPSALLETAIVEALKNRPEIAELQTTAEINEINKIFLKDQTKPQVNLVGTYTSNGLAGGSNPTIRTSTPIDANLLARINQLSTLQGIPALVIPQTTTISPPPSNLIGNSFSSLVNLFQNDFPTYRAGVSISLPWKNRVAEAELGQALAQETQIKNLRSQAEILIEADVRNALQTLRSAESRLNSANAARIAAEQLYESEQRQFRAGTTTVFLVFQRQNDLLNSQSRELQAQTDLNKAIANYYRATGQSLTINKITVQ